MKGVKLEWKLSSVTCLSQHLSDLIKRLRLPACPLTTSCASPLATSYSCPDEATKETGCVKANIGASTVSVVVCLKTACPYRWKSSPIGSSHITNDIALGLRIPLDEAEKIKINYGTENTVSKKKLSDIIEARLNDIFEMIENHLKKINRNQVLPAGAILTGSGSNLFSVEEIAKASLKLPAQIGTLMPSNNNSLLITAPTTN